MPCKFIAEFQQNSQGWSEVYYVNFTNPTDFLTVSTSGVILTTAPAFTWLLKRVDLATTDVFITYLRCSQVGVPRNVVICPIAPGIGVGTYPIEGGLGIPRSGEPTEVFSSLLIRQGANSIKAKNLYLAGIPEDIVTPPNVYNPSATFITRLGLFLTHLKNNVYGVVGRQSAITAPVAQPLSFFLVGAQGTSAQVSPLVQPPGAPLQWYTIVRGMKYPRGWNGIHRTVVDPSKSNSMILGPTRKSGVALPVWDIGGAGTVQALVAPFTPINVAQPIRIVEHKRGRPFAQLVGRRK